MVNNTQQSLTQHPDSTESAANTIAPTGDGTQEPQQPKHRYMTRSVAQNAARRKQEELMAETLYQQQTHNGVADKAAEADESSGAVPGTSLLFGQTTQQQPSPYISETVVASGQTNPYYMMTAANEQRQGSRQQPPPTWTSTALYQAARAVAAAATAPSTHQQQQQQAMATVNPAAMTIQAATSTGQQHHRKQNPAAPPPAKRRRNAAAASNTTTTAQQQQKGGARGRAGHYIVVPGREVTSRFKIRRLLGQGTFGKVMECDDLVSGRLVAVKVIRAVPKYRDAAKIEVRVLQTLERNDPTNVYQCIHLNETFDFRNHVCMVFDLLGPSVFDFLKENEFRPFSLHHVQLFAEQLLRSVAFLHSLNLVHTDLKPENILLESGEYDVVPFGSSQAVKTRMLKSTKIRLIDFGSATFNNEYHSQVVSTRHYRAPEIILNLGWSFPCDMWSIGCIILELLTGEALFQTHDNNEHLAMMEIVVGKAPSHIVRAVSSDLRSKFFRSNGTARYPAPENTRQSQKGMRSMRLLSQLVNPSTNPIYANLHDLLFQLLQYDPNARITAKEACSHPFFCHRVGPDGRLVDSLPATANGQQTFEAVTSPNSDAVALSASLRSHRPSLQTAVSSNAVQLNPPATVGAHALSTHAYAASSGKMARIPSIQVQPTEYNNAHALANNMVPQPQPQSQPHHPQSHPQQPQQYYNHVPVFTKPVGSGQVNNAYHGYYYRDQQPQKVPSATATAPSSTYHPVSDYAVYQTPNHYNYPSSTTQQQQTTGQNVRMYTADGHQWQYVTGANGPAPTTPLSAHGSNAQYAFSVQQPQQTQQPPIVEQQHTAGGFATASSQTRTDGKRKTGVPIDSGYFPDIPLSASDYNSSSYFSSGSGYTSPNINGNLPGAPSLVQKQQNQVIPRNHYSSGPSFTGASSSSSSANVPNSSIANRGGYNLPPLASYVAQLPSYYQQRYQPANSSLSSGTVGGAGGNSSSLQGIANGSTVLPRMLPVDANTTPTLTIATTATPTPGSTSTQLGGSHSMDASGSIATSSAALGNSSSVTGSVYSGSQQHSVGRMLPSLMAVQNGGSVPHVNAINNGLARTSIADTMQQQQKQQYHRYPPVSSGAATPQQGMYQQIASASPMLLQPSQVSSARSSFYPQLPSAQSLMQQHLPQTPPGRNGFSLEQRSHHHHYQYS
ncbi:serine threonine protein kinase CMGC group [Coemansia sp. IMI 209127]|nr:serine threonine protein kinase CMGC group [Coemansia sp. IMI 209127]